MSPSRHANVALVSMPFGPLLLPSLGLSLLKAAVLAGDPEASVKLHYLTIEFAKEIEPDLYAHITAGDTTCNLLGEWMFSDALFPDGGPAKEYLEEVLAGGETWTADVAEGTRMLSDTWIERLLSARDMVPAFLERSAALIVSQAPDVIGFTSMFDQHVGALALARTVKDLSPGTPIIFGGPNCEDVMGEQLVREFPWVDAAVSGEGEVVFPEIVRRLLDGRSYADLPGVRVCRPVNLLRSSGPLSAAEEVATMDDLPEPDLDDYFQQYAEANFDWDQKPTLLFETSRGCWWGQKHHCTFCGLNGTTMRYRSKSSARVLRELKTLTDRHPGLPVTVVDNILDSSYFQDLIPELAREGGEVDLFYEVKANLRRPQVEALHAAGIRTLQPGIESLNDHVLELMDKGVRALQNVQLLKWCKEIGITVVWNILWGTPDESPEDYVQMAGMMRQLSHLEPPVSARPILLNRFSPLFDEAERFGVTNIRPVPAYGHVYAALAPQAVANLAYYFDFDYARGQDVASYTTDVAAIASEWSASYRSGSDLLHLTVDGQVIIWDLRPEAVAPLTVLADRLLIDVFAACDPYCSPSAVLRSLELQHDELTLEDVEDVLAALVERRLVVSDGRAFLSLPVRLGPYAPGEQTMARLREVRANLGDEDAEGFVVGPEVLDRATLRLAPAPAMPGPVGQ